jgi:DNA-3-methyladenine glycosylase I
VQTVPRRSQLAALPNLGPTTEKWLNAIGVYTRRDLAQLGPVNAYCMLKGHGFNVSLNLVYAIHATLNDTDWRRLPTRVRNDLKAAVAHATKPQPRHPGRAALASIPGGSRGPLCRDAQLVASIPSAKPRCAWCGTDPLYVRYHDEEWGVPVHDDRKHFEFLILEGAQAGLSWITILRKRENYREAFEGFDPARVARFGKREVARLMKNPGIVRNRLKIEGAAKNARAFLAVQDEFGGFDRYVWRFVGGRPIQNRWTHMNELPARTPESDALSKDLKKRGFTFVGSTIIYAHMQAVGMVNDHVVDCYRYKRLGGRR